MQLNRAEEALAYERDLLRALLDNVPDAIYFKDRESRFIRLGKVLGKAFGLEDPEAATGKTDFDFFPPAIATQYVEEDRRVIASAEPLTDQIWLVPDSQGLLQPFGPEGRVPAGYGRDIHLARGELSPMGNHADA